MSIGPMSDEEKEKRRQGTIRVLQSPTVCKRRIAGIRRSWTAERRIAVGIERRAWWAKWREEKARKAAETATNAPTQ